MSNVQPTSPASSRRRQRGSAPKPSMRASGAAVNAKIDAFDAPVGRRSALGATWVASRAEKRLCGLQSAPPELLAFVRAGSVTSVAGQLGLSRAMVYLLRDGYWPANPERILQAWAESQARRGRVASSWFLRRVQPGGRVRHAGREWSCAALGQCEGQLVAVARASASTLLAQTLELPARRLQLEVAA